MTDTAPAFARAPWLGTARPCLAAGRGVRRSIGPMPAGTLRNAAPASPTVRP